jgi:hypothetical protein
VGNSRKMKDALTMALFSRRKLTPLVAREQIAALSSFGGGLMRPDKCSEAEPIRSLSTLRILADLSSGC